MDRDEIIIIYSHFKAKIRIAMLIRHHGSMHGLDSRVI